MYAYFWILICIFFISTSLSVFEDLNILVCPALGVWNGQALRFRASLLLLPSIQLKPLCFWYLKIVLRSYIMPLLQWNLTIWAWQQRDLSRSLDIRYRFPAVLAFQRLPRSRQSWRLQWDQGLGKYLIVYWVISWHRYKPWQNYHHLKNLSVLWSTWLTTPSQLLPVLLQWL